VSAILDLGPTFIKIGQLSSTRADLFPAAFTEELAQLQVGGWVGGAGGGGLGGWLGGWLAGWLAGWLGDGGL
jgi:hypothetical protein